MISRCGGVRSGWRRVLGRLGGQRAALGHQLSSGAGAGPARRGAGAGPSVGGKAWVACRGRARAAGSYGMLCRDGRARRYGPLPKSGNPWMGASAHHAAGKCSCCLEARLLAAVPLIDRPACLAVAPPRGLSRMLSWLAALIYWLPSLSSPVGRRCPHGSCPRWCSLVLPAAPVASRPDPAAARTLLCPLEPPCTQDALRDWPRAGRGGAWDQCPVSLKSAPTPRMRGA